MKHIALLGNPNAGKTTLFNELTGTSQHVGNWPGVTVEKKEGSLRQAYGGGAQVVDLPGVYSLNPHSIEEQVARAYILEEHPDVIIDVVEATNLERNLFLTCQIAELGVPIVIALNMMDEAEKAGHRIDVEMLSEMLGLPVVPITAVKGEGVAELVGTAMMQATGHNAYKGPSILRAFGDVPTSDEEESASAAVRYTFIEKVAASAVRKVSKAGSGGRIGTADAILTNKWVGIPIFLLIMFSMFHVTFSENFLFLQSFGFTAIPSPGVWLQNMAESGIAWFGSVLTPYFLEGSWSYGLVIDGVIGGVGSVLSFLPQIMVLFFFLTIFEDIGYMSRVAFIMDRVLRTFGLSGKSFLPMLMGFGCTVPAAMACRTMENEDDRKMTLFLVPFMSCGARAPIFLVFCAAFFPAHADLVVFGMYILGVLVAVLTGLVLKRIVFRGATTPLIIELPRYRAPRVKSLGLSLWKTMKDYVTRAGTVIFVMSIAIWFLSNFGWTDGAFGMVSMDASLLAIAGNVIAPVFSPLGFGFWAAAVALITGLAAKEAVISSLGVLYNVDKNAAFQGSNGFAAALSTGGFTPLIALSFMVFSLLYIPCFAAFATLKREFNSLKWALLQAVYSLIVAWLLSFLVYRIGSTLGFA